MKLYRLSRNQTLPIPIDQAWEYFSNPSNLAEITPPWLGFEILKDQSDDLSEMYAGMMIQYRIRLMPMVKIRWVSQISHVRKPYFFADTQLSGPYKFWYHEHMFESVSGGTSMRDTVYYALPFGPVGRVARSLMVKRQLEAIFNFRAEKMADLFG